MLRVLLSLFALSITLQSVASEPDSLYSAWMNESSSDSLRLDAMDAMVWNQLFRRPDTAETLANQMLDYAISVNDKGWQGRAYYYKAISHQLRHDLEGAERFCSQASTLFDRDRHKRWMARNYVAEAMILRELGRTGEAVNVYKSALTVLYEAGDSAGIASVYNNLGVIAMDRGRIEEAIENYSHTLSIAQSTHLPNTEAVALANLAVIAWKQDQTKQALEYWNLALEIRQETGDVHGQAVCYNGIGAMDLKNGKFESAIENFELAMTLADSVNDVRTKSHAMGNLGSVFRNLKQYDRAVEYFFEVMKINNEIGDPEPLTTTYTQLAEALHESGKRSESKKWAQKAFDLGTEIGVPDQIRDASRVLADLYEEEGNYKKAMEFYTIHIAMRDSTNNLETNRISIRQQEKYRYDQQRILLEQAAAEKEGKLREDALKAENDLLSEEAESQQLMKWIVVLSLVVVLILGILIVARLRRKSERLKREKASQLKISEQLIYWQEEERKRVAHDLHDGLGQQLSIIKNNLQGNDWKLDEMIDSVGQAIQEVRNVSDALRPRQLDMLGLKIAIEELVDETFANTDVELQVEVSEIDGRLPVEKEVSLYRIVQEAVHNILKYADCNRVTISIHDASEQTFFIRIEDDGNGFDHSKVEQRKDGGFGLRGMQERVNFLEGKFNIQSEIGRGTLIEISIPVVSQ